MWWTDPRMLAAGNARSLPGGDPDRMPVSPPGPADDVDDDMGAVPPRPASDEYSSLPVLDPAIFRSLE